jgi:signal transduction histidine kinase
METSVPIRVLLIDDDEDYYILTRDLLREAGEREYRLTWASNYDDGLAALASNAHDVALLDYNLGAHTGLELLKAVFDQAYGVPLIMLTGQNDHAIDLETMRAGAADYLTKNRVDAAILARAIRYAIERAQALAALRSSERRIAQLYEQEREHSRALERAYADLRTAERLRDDLTHMIVHDLRNPLTAILGNLDTLPRYISDPAKAELCTSLVATAGRAGRRMKRLIDDLLDVGKLEAGELHLRLVALDVADWLVERQESYRLQADAEDKRFIWNLTGDLPAVMADADLIGRVLDNLVNNAFKYTDSGGAITVGATHNDAQLVVTVRDDGQGIPLKDQARIFDKFVQVTDEHGAPLRKGSGLGLAFCRLAVQAHGGRIWVESAPGQGSAFSFSLPLAPAG